MNVTDGNHCTTSLQLNITEPPALISSITNPVNVSCFGGNDGAASAIAAGGTPPYRYAWQPAGQVDPYVIGLTAGSYSVLVTDSNGCTASSAIQISEPPALQSSLQSAAMVSCYGGNDGAAALQTSGGTPPYGYAWSSVS